MSDAWDWFKWCCAFWVLAMLALIAVVSGVFWLKECWTDYVCGRNEILASRERIAALEALLRPLTAFIGSGPPFDGLPDEHVTQVPIAVAWYRRMEALLGEDER